ncbi:inositol 2-dehydrogenase [Bradyrhizobium sp. HKCCYLS1011]|uniref:inositol 2-dehydrogenase n=1 Tax=Bradyrhizobium sp. HKCCYLS1011 TaxID=3420733 RepID=UPI003EB7E288
MAIKFALLGCGRIGVLHARNLAGAEGARLETVFDPNTSAAEAVASANGCRVAATAGDAIEKADAVLIATSTPTHADLIELAAKAGKAILCEKPIDLNLDRVRACRKAIEGCNVPIQIGFNRRFDPGHRAAREACAAGKIGKLEQVVITSRDPGMPPRNYVAVSGGIFRDMTIHDFDVARFMLNDEPTEVFATGSALVDPATGSDFGDFDSIMVIMRTADGKLCHINNSRRATFGYDQRIELFGSEGMVISDNKKKHELKFYGSTTTDAAEPYLNFFIERYAEAYQAEIAAFIAAVRNGRPIQATFDDGYRALVLAEAAVESAKTGKKVEVRDIA